MNEKYKKEIEAFLPFNFPEHVLTDLYEYYRVKEAYIDRRQLPTTQLNSLKWGLAKARLTSLSVSNTTLRENV